VNHTWMTTALLMVSWQSTWRILAWQSLKPSDWIFWCIACTKNKYYRLPLSRCRIRYFVTAAVNINKKMFPQLMIS